MTTSRLLLLVAVICFIVQFVLSLTGTDVGKVNLIALGLAFFAGSMLV